MTMFDERAIWLSLNQCNSCWPIWVHSDPTWSNVIHVGPFGSTLIQFDPIWSNLIQYDPKLFKISKITKKSQNLTNLRNIGDKKVFLGPRVKLNSQSKTVEVMNKAITEKSRGEGTLTLEGVSNGARHNWKCFLA